MANAEKDRVEAETLAKLQADPELAKLAAQIQTMKLQPARFGTSEAERRNLINQYRDLATSKGLIPQNYQAAFGPNGVSVDFQNWFERNSEKLIGTAAAALVTAGLAVPALSGGGAAAGGSTIPAQTVVPAATGGTTAGSYLSRIPKLLDDVGPILGELEAGRASGRQAEDAANIRYDEAGIARSRVAQDDYQRNLSNALRGGLLQGAQDANIQPPAGIPMGTVSGGLRPSAILGREQIGKDLQAAATKHLLDADASDDTRTPVMSPRPTSGALDTGLNTLAPALSITDLILDNVRRSSAPKPASPIPAPGVTFRNTQPVSFGGRY